MTAERRDNDASRVARRRQARCPVCGKPTVAEFRPFCSRRCADIDLNRWLSGAYAIAGAAGDERDDDGQD